MAKAKSKARAKRTKAKPATRAKSKARSSAKTKARGRTKPKARRKATAQLPGEKAVTRTTRTIPVEPERAARGPGEEEPMPDPAVDRRRQIVGTDELPGRPIR